MDDERQERFRALYVSARPRIGAYALRRSRSYEDAADAVAETFAIAWRRIGDVPEGDGALLWLYATARHVLANERRRGRRRTDLISRIGSVLFEHGASVEPADGTGLVAVSALRSLERDDREVLMLTAWEGLDAADLGRVLGCSPGAARIRLHRARRRLDALIAALTSGGPDEPHPDFAGHRGNEGAALGCAEEA